MVTTDDIRRFSLKIRRWNFARIGVVRIACCDSALELQISDLVMTLLRFVWFLLRSARICFDDQVHFCSGFQLSLLTVLAGYLVFNSYLPIQIVRTVNVDLCFLRLAGDGRFDDLLDGALQLFPFFAHRD
jgi:hypothetical protein